MILNRYPPSLNSKIRNSCTCLPNGTSTLNWNFNKTSHCRRFEIIVRNLCYNLNIFVSDAFHWQLNGARNMDRSKPAEKVLRSLILEICLGTRVGEWIWTLSNTPIAISARLVILDRSSRPVIESWNCLITFLSYFIVSFGCLMYLALIEIGILHLTRSDASDGPLHVTNCWLAEHFQGSPTSKQKVLSELNLIFSSLPRKRAYQTALYKFKITVKMKYVLVSGGMSIFPSSWQDLDVFWLLSQVLSVALAKES